MIKSLLFISAGDQQADFNRLLAEHLDAYFQAVHRQGLPAKPGAPMATVISTSNLLNGFLVAEGASAQIIASLDGPVAQPAYSLWLTWALASLWLIALASPPPLNPPRDA